MTDLAAMLCDFYEVVIMLSESDEDTIHDVLGRLPEDHALRRAFHCGVICESCFAVDFVSNLSIDPATGDPHCRQCDGTGLRLLRSGPGRKAVAA